MNKIVIIGRLCADPELRTTNAGIAVCGFRVAVNRRFNREETDFFPVNVWREAANNCSKYLRKGSQVCVSGSLQIRNYEQDGVKKQIAEIQADEVEFLGGKSDNAEGGGAALAPSRKETPKVKELEEVENYGEMPF